MNHLLIVITYSVPGHPPAITSAVVPIQSHLTFDAQKKKVYDQYRTKQYYDVTITEF